MPTVAILLKIADELAQMAKSAMPKFRDGEKLIKEWFSDGCYFRETVLDGKTTVIRFDFRKRKVC